MTVRCILFFYLFTYGLTVQSQTVYEEVLDQYIFGEQQEKAYLHLDKPQYAAGDELWFKAYITSAVTHLPTEVSSTLYVELINQESIIVDSLTLFIQDGTSHGSFTLESDLAPGIYRIRAYTEWMRNLGKDFFYRKEFMIVNPIIDTELKAIPNQRSDSNKLKAQFFPEGGDLIDRLTTRVAVKLTHRNITNLQLKGVIINDKGKKISDFESNQFGYASFIIDPKLENSYLAIIEEDTFQLPKVRKSGAAIKVLQRQNSDFLQISVQASAIDLSGGTLIIHRRGQLLLSEKCLDKSNMAIRVDKLQLGTGIIHVTFFDKNKIPLSERLIFPNPNSDEAEIEINSNRKVYNKRSKVSLEISSKNNDTISSASITINPLTESSYGRYNENIENYLLLNSDLKGKIESPNYYFTGTNQAYKSLDLLMLTHGWSRFNWTTLIDSTSFSPKFLPEKGLKFSGSVSNSNNDNTIDEFLIGLTIPSLGIIRDTILVNNDKGKFQIVDLKLKDSTLVFIQVYKETNRKIKKYKNAEVQVEYPTRPSIAQFSNPRSDVKREYIEKVKKLNQISEAYFLDNKAFELEEVVVRGNKFEERAINVNALYREPSNRIIVDSLRAIDGYQNVIDIIRQMPGAMIMGTGFKEKIMIRGTEPIYFINNVKVDLQAIRYLPIEEVMVVDVLKGPKAAIFGARGASGVVAVYTRKGEVEYRESEEQPNGLYSFMHPGYHKAKEFYSANYDDENQKTAVPDYRTTLYWNPNLDFKDNTAIESFYSSDQAGSYIIRIEGMLTNGRPFFEESFIEVD